MQNGGGWVEYLRLTDLEELAAAPAAGLRQHGSDELEPILARFEKTASNSDYAVITGKKSFGRTLRVLQNRAGAERQP